MRNGNTIEIKPGLSYLEWPTQPNDAMRKAAPLCLLVLLVWVKTAIAQSGSGLSAQQILEKSIAYHDPQGRWAGFRADFRIEMITPGRPKRVSRIRMDHPGQAFDLEVERGKDRYAIYIKADSCRIAFQGSDDIPEQVAKELNLNCDRGRFYRDYYTYLYGLPMKLRDPGTRLDARVQRKLLEGKEYWVLRANYEAEVGTDTWYFYFDPESYAMEAYQFYHDEAQNDGEYILLEGLETVGGIRMPRVRSWYTNRDKKLLGTDTLYGD